MKAKITTGKTMLQNKKLARGRSMVEMLGVLGIMAMITALGIIAYTQATQMFRIDKLKNEIATIRIHIQTKLQGSDFDKYAFSNDANIDKEVKTYFDNLFINTGTLNKNITPMGSETHYGFGKSGADGVFFITIFGLTEDECNSIKDLYKETSHHNNCNLRSNKKYRLAIYFET